MKFLIDNALSPSIAHALRENGFDAVHVHAIGMGASSDQEILDFALREDRIVVSADTDFGTLLTLQESSKPSFILFRRTDKRPISQINLLIRNMENLKGDLLKGCIVVFDDERIRIRALPVTNEK